MDKKRKSFARRFTGRILIWTFLIVLGVSYVILNIAYEAARRSYLDICYNKMLITNEYTRRVLSDVYVAVSNNIYYLERELDNPDGHKKTMERIVKSGTRIRSCGISFIEDYYYPQKEHRFCPFAWRNVAKPNEIYSQDMGDAAFNYLNSDWFLDIINSDSARWSEPFFDDYDKKIALTAYTVPIHDSNGRIVAVLGADISLDWLSDKLNEQDNSINQSAIIEVGNFEMESNSFIINHDGLFITHSDENRIIKDNFFSHLKPIEGDSLDGLIKRIKEGVGAEDRDRDKYLVNGKECYVMYSPVKYTQWVLVTIVPCHAIRELSYFYGVPAIASVLLGLLIIVLVGYYSIKRGIAPLKQLTAVTDDMAQGKFDTPLPNTSYNDETGILRDSIEELQYTLSNYAADSNKGLSENQQEDND